MKYKKAPSKEDSGLGLYIPSTRVLEFWPFFSIFELFQYLEKNGLIKLKNLGSLHYKFKLFSTLSRFCLGDAHRQILDNVSKSLKFVV